MVLFEHVLQFSSFRINSERRYVNSKSVYDKIHDTARNPFSFSLDTARNKLRIRLATSTFYQNTCLSCIYMIKNFENDDFDVLCDTKYRSK